MGQQRVPHIIAYTNRQRTDPRESRGGAMRARPRFKWTTAISQEEMVGRIKGNLALPDCKCEGDVRRDHALILIDPELRHFWSPTLDLSFRTTDEGSTVSGIFGPHPEVWTMFVFLWSALVAAWIGGAILAGVQQFIGESPQGLWIVLAASIGLGISCTINVLGRRTGEDQMEKMQAFLTETVETRNIQHTE